VLATVLEIPASRSHDTLDGERPFHRGAALHLRVENGDGHSV